jgi:hypothetical protein
LEALSVRVPAGVDEERLYHHWDGPSEFTKIAHGLRGWVGEDENGDAIDEAAAEANADAARPRRLENLLTAQRERDHEYTLYATGAGGSGSIPGPSDYASGFEVRTIPHDDPRVTLRRKHGAFATRRWDAFEIVAPYAAVVSTREEFEDACADASFDVANRRRSYAVTTETEIQTSPGAAPTPLVFCAADARRANPMRCVNDPAVDPTRKDASRWGALRAHAFKEANCQIIESVDRWGWPRLRVMTTRELHVGDEFLMSYGREYWGFEKRTTEATETMRDVADAAEAEALRSAAAKRGAFYTLVPIRPRSRGERRSLRTLPGVSLRPPLAFKPRPRRLSTPTDAFQLHPTPPSRGGVAVQVEEREGGAVAERDREGGRAAGDSQGAGRGRVGPRVTTDETTSGVARRDTITTF